MVLPRLGTALGLGLAVTIWESSRLLEVDKNWNQSYGAFAFAILILARHSIDKYLTKAVILRPLFYCGTICHSLYLAHVPVITLLKGSLLYVGVPLRELSIFITSPIAWAICLFVANLVHHGIERDFLNSSPAIGTA